LKENNDALPAPSVNGVTSDPLGAHNGQTSDEEKGPPRILAPPGLDALTLGAPRYQPDTGSYVTDGGVEVDVCSEELDYLEAQTMVRQLAQTLDDHKGVLLSSSYIFPGRYARWSLGFAKPPLEVVGSGRDFRIKVLNQRGRPLLAAIMDALKTNPVVEGMEGGVEEGGVSGRVKEAEPGQYFPEEERSKQPSLFNVIRQVVELMGYRGDPQLGLYGALGYDLTFQFDPIDLSIPREPHTQRDLVLYLPDEILVVDQEKKAAWKLGYEFSYGGHSTKGLERTGVADPYVGATETDRKRDTPPGDYSRKVERARKEFACGNLFEVVLSQNFLHPCPDRPSEVFQRLQQRNPAPYGLFLNLGEKEYLVGASPEMFVRCEPPTVGAEEGALTRVETCPISGTIARGSNPLEDARQIKSILMNTKEESELTMCTDVDRNDKSRICVPGSVKVLGRRQIEMYSRLIHTVDHVEGYLRPGFDALDAFLCHTWAVTVTGAPKKWAIQFIEQQESSPRHWYGGAVGLIGFDGHLNTGLTLRTVRIKEGVAEVRAGATLLFDSVPDAEEKETELKALAQIDAIIRPDTGKAKSTEQGGEANKDDLSLAGEGKRVLLIDHQDSFVHTLGNYLRQTGAHVLTCRSGPNALGLLDKEEFDLVVLSPGPGNPDDFNLKATIHKLLERRLPAFGVCLGLQGMVEYFGGSLGMLGYPMHGKPSSVRLKHSDTHVHPIFQGLPEEFEVARYHSLYGLEASLPPCLRPTSYSSDNVVMSIEHKDLPFAAVQFHPESILTNPKHGLQILANCLKYLPRKKAELTQGTEKEAAAPWL